MTIGALSREFGPARPCRVSRLRLALATVGLSVLGALPLSAQSLSDTLIMAYRTSNLLEQNRAVLRAADEDVGIAIAALRPVMAYALNSSITPDNWAFDDTNYAQISASITLYEAGRNKLATEAAKELVLATRQSLVGVEQQVLLAAVRAFMNVRSQLEYVRLRQRNVQVIEQQLRAAQDRFEVGEVTRTDVSLAEARLAAARSALVAAKGDLAVARESYKAATGAYPTALSAPPTAPATANTVDEARSYGTQNHPSIKQIQHEVRAGELNVRRAIAANNGKLTASAYLRHTQDVGDTSNITLNFSQTISSGGGLMAAARKAQASAERARAGLLQQGVVVSQEVSNAWSQLDVARARIAASDLQIAAARLAFDGISEEAKLGARTTLDVLDAEQEVLNAEVDKISAVNQRYVAVYALLSAMGLLTVDHLKLGIVTYDPEAYYNAAKLAPELMSAQGRKLNKVFDKIGGPKSD